jgi:hypothetical protein
MIDHEEFLAQVRGCFLSILHTSVLHLRRQPPPTKRVGSGYWRVSITADASLAEALLLAKRDSEITRLAGTHPRYQRRRERLLARAGAEASGLMFIDFV